MLKSYKQFNLFLASLVLAVFVMPSAVPVMASSLNPVQTTTTSVNYVVHMNSGSALQNAPGVTDVKPMFEFTKNSTFSNTFEFKSTLSLDQLRQNLSGQYISLDVDHQFSTGAVTTNATGLTKFPNDPGLTTNSSNIDKQWGLVKAGFLDAWKKTTGDRDTVVAVVDTGIDGTHEDLTATRFVNGYNVITKSSLSGHINSDDNGHGTLISGVIAATANNGIGISGAAPGVSLMPVKALDASGSGSSSQISQAIVWAADHEASVINLSLGGIGFAHDKVLADAITYAYDKDVVIVAAAGNDVAVTGGNLDKDPVFPICDDNGKNMIIGVTATDYNDVKPSFANFGKACVDVSAPGKRILSTINHDPATGGSSPDSYAYASGTSLAVPFVSSEAALLRSLFPQATNRQISDRIIQTSVNIDNLNITQCASKSCAGLLGGGRIDANKSLQEQIIKIKDGDLVKLDGTSTIYFINGGKKQLVSPFVINQRFPQVTPRTVTTFDLSPFPEGSYAEPLNGTVVKSASDPTVYYMESGLKRPMTYQVFTLRQYSFANVSTVTNAEVASWITGSLLPPPDNTLLRSPKNPTIYWVVNGSLRPINYKFYITQGLNNLPVVLFSDSDIGKFPKGDAYIIN